MYNRFLPDIELALERLLLLERPAKCISSSLSYAPLKEPDADLDRLIIGDVSSCCNTLSVCTCCTINSSVGSLVDRLLASIVYDTLGCTLNLFKKVVCPNVSKNEYSHI